MSSSSHMVVTHSSYSVVKEVHVMKIKSCRHGVAMLLAVGVLTWTVPAFTQQAIQVDPSIPSYKVVSGISGNLNSIGSDTLNNVMTFWAEGFKKFYPNINIQI